MGRFIPRGITPRGGWRKAAWHIFWMCGLLVAPVGLFAQTADTIPTYHIAYRSCRLPFNMANDPHILEVLLYASTDNGKTYRYINSARPTDRHFLYQAQSDGWYSFIVQTRDQNGTMTPADIREAQPSIRVCVDTEKPVITRLEQASPQEGLPVIRWAIEEANFHEVWADYRSTKGGPWYPLLLPAQANGEFRWKPAIGGELEVRMQARDKAGNQSEPKTVFMRVADTVAGMPPPPENSNVIHVRSRTFQLKYELDNRGPSGVPRVEVWKIRPGGGWQKCREYGDGNGPIQVTVDLSGRWGFRLIPRNGVGLAERDPQPGDPPDVWVEVDDRRPDVKVTKVAVNQTPDGGYLTVSWTANDTFLRANPIAISYSLSGQGDWKPLAPDLPNTGSWSHKTDDLNLGSIYQFYLKVSAIDEAGNVGEDQWRETVKVDLKIPRVSGVKVIAPSVSPGTSSSSSVPDGQQTSRPLQVVPSAPKDFANPMGGP
jgi:hypothetical protein